MILGGNERWLISSIGWVERGSFVRRDLSNNELRTFACERADYVRVDKIDDSRFATVGYRRSADSLEVCVRRFDAAQQVFWGLNCSFSGIKIQGDPAQFIGAKRYYLWNTTVGSSLLTISADGEDASLSSLDWYNGKSYDLGYQGLVDVVAVPESAFVIISVQRSSTLVIHDPNTGHVIDHIDLADRYGNPTLHIEDGELWTVDYDTFVRVSLATSKAIDKVLIQPGRGRSQLFAGEPFIGPMPRRAFIPRPYSGDIAILDPAMSRVESYVRVKRQPLVCAVTKSGQVIARDWKSGDWLFGQTKLPVITPLA